MTDVVDPDQTASRDVTRLREMRSGLEQLVRELMTWIGLLRNKALALRALSGRSGKQSPDPLAPGSLDPRALADILASGASTLRSPAVGRTPRRLVGVGAEGAIERARSLWDAVADPKDSLASESLADAAERLAAQLEVRVNEALDEYELLGEELDRALTRHHLEHATDPNSAEASADAHLDSLQTPGRNS